MRTLLDPNAVQQNLAQLSGWGISTDRRAIEKGYLFDTFSAAFSFMTQVAFLAERADHHPDWRNVFNRVDIRLTTHDRNGLTQKDFDLAHAIDLVHKA